MMTNAKYSNAPRSILVAMIVCASIVTVDAQEERWKELSVQAVEYFQQRRYDEATASAEQSLKVAEQTFGLRDAKVASSLNNLAALHKVRGKYDLAEALFMRALTIYEEHPHRYQKQIATLINNLTEVYEQQGNAEAIAAMEIRLSELLMAAKPSDPPVAAHKVEVMEEPSAAEAPVQDVEPEHVETKTDVKEQVAVATATAPSVESKEQQQGSVSTPVLMRRSGPSSAYLAISANAFRLSQDERTQMAWILKRALGGLSADEQYRLTTLHELARGERERQISFVEIEEMRQLQKQALAGLPSEDKDGFQDLLIRAMVRAPEQP